MVVNGMMRSCNLDGTCRLPPSSQGLYRWCTGWVVWCVVSMLHHSVTSTLHVAEGGHHAVSQLWSHAGGTHVRGIESNAVGPAVIDDGAISRQWLVSKGDSSKCSVCVVGNARGCITGRGCNDSICMLEPGLCTGEGFNVSVVLFLEHQHRVHSKS